MRGSARRIHPRRVALGLCALLVIGAGAAADGTFAAEDGGAGRAPTERGAEAHRQGSTLRGAEYAAADTSADEATRAAVERALAWLAARQEELPHGGFPPAGAEKHAPVAATSLAALAFMAVGNTPERGPHGARVSAAIEYLLARVDLDPKSPTLGYVSQESDPLSRTHGHGFATLALAEAYAMSPRSALGRRIERALPLAVGLIERAQGSEGGWEYKPYRVVEHENSVTITLVQALRAARNAGIRVDAKVIGRALEYVHKSQKEDGSFRYSLGSDITTVAITAACVATLNAGGEYTGPAVTQGFDYLLRELEARELELERTTELRRGSQAKFPCYERLYVAQALWQHPDPAVFDRWFAAERRWLLRTQNEDGSWTSGPEQEYGRVYATAVNALVLAMPDRLLPIFQR